MKDGRQMRQPSFVSAWGLENELVATHNGGMKARERWTENLQCPQCGKIGEAQLSRADTYAFLMGDNETSVDFVSDGFSCSRDGEAVNFSCAHCQVGAAWMNTGLKRRPVPR